MAVYHKWSGSVIAIIGAGLKPTPGSFRRLCESPFAYLMHFASGRDDSVIHYLANLSPRSLVPRAERAVGVAAYDTMAHGRVDRIIEMAPRRHVGERRRLRRHQLRPGSGDRHRAHLATGTC